MPSRKSPRKGSLQFWPRKRASKFLPRVNWNAITKNSSKNIKGFICYKAGMVSVFVKDITEHSMTKGKKIVVPATVLECPPMKIFSVRFYRQGKLISEILAENPDKELKRKLKLPKTGKSREKIDKVLEKINYDDIRLIAYSQVKKAGIKKTPDLIEIGMAGSPEDKLKFVREKFGKEISVVDVFQKGQLVDIRGLTKGFGLSGPVKRFGITLKSHKSEKGRRRPGSIGPWHPARVTFRTPMAGQLGMFARVTYNSKIIDIGNVHEHKKLKNMTNFGDIRTDYIIIRGSVQGTAKRVLIATAPLRETKKQSKKAFEFIELR